MPRRPRWHKPDAAYCEVQRTADRQFFFLPEEKIRQIIGASVGRAQRLYPVKLFWLDCNINHKQSGKAALSNSAEHIANLVKFDQLCNSLIARGINGYIEREGGMFSSRNRSAEAIDDASLENQLFYAVTNPAKDNLVDKISHWKGFSSYEQLATGKVEKFSYINRTAWHQAGGKRSKKKLEEFTEWVEVKLSPIPSWEGMPEHKRQSKFRREVRELEQHFREERKRFGNRPMGPKKLAKLDPRDRPKRPAKKTGNQPLCHSSTKEGAVEYKEQYRAFLEFYYYASMYWMKGVENVPFPPGSYKAPLINVAA
jgi:hypothetical protein